MNRWKKFIELTEIFMRIINKQKMLDDSPRKYGTKHLLYKSEIHMIETIGKYPGENITELSNRLGVTKGAVSQIVKKLVKNKFVIKTNKPGNEKEIVLQLTDKGIEAYKAHEIFHQNHFKEFIKSFDNASDKQILFIEELFNKIENKFDEFIKYECCNECGKK